MFHRWKVERRASNWRRGALGRRLSPRQPSGRARNTASLRGLPRCLAAGALMVALPLLLVSCNPGKRNKSALQAEAVKRSEVFQAFLSRESLRQAADDSSQKFAEVDREFQQLLERFKPLKFSREVQLAAFDFALTSENRYRLSLMFKVDEELPEDYKIHVHAYVGDEHLAELSENRQVTGFENWQISPQPPTSEWKPGRYYVFTKNVQAKPIPYRMKVALAIKRSNKWVRLGKEVTIGWVMGSRESGAPETADPEKSSVNGK